MQFKFNPFYVMLVSLPVLFFLYKTFTMLPQPWVSWINFFTCIPIILIAYFILPMTFKMILNMSALLLTGDCLNNKMGGYSIAWTDIASIELYSGASRGFAKLAINLKDPKKYFNTPIKMFLYKTRQLFVVNDKSIYLDFVSGENEMIFAVIKSYWTKEVKD